jgi:hypothetical protein
MIISGSARFPRVRRSADREQSCEECRLDRNCSGTRPTNNRDGLLPGLAFHSEHILAPFRQFDRVTELVIGRIAA